jgi:hypothetical protein
MISGLRPRHAWKSKIGRSANRSDVSVALTFICLGPFAAVVAQTANKRRHQHEILGSLFKNRRGSSKFVVRWEGPTIQILPN